jgi:hypothetical protein
VNIHACENLKTRPQINLNLSIFRPLQAFLYLIPSQSKAGLPTAPIAQETRGSSRARQTTQQKLVLPVRPVVPTTSQRKHVMKYSLG